jgi:hypothetical protein
MFKSCPKPTGCLSDTLSYRPDLAMVFGKGGEDSIDLTKFVSAKYYRFISVVGH